MDFLYNLSNVVDLLICLSTLEIYVWIETGSKWKRNGEINTHLRQLQQSFAMGYTCRGPNTLLKCCNANTLILFFACVSKTASKERFFWQASIETPAVSCRIIYVLHIFYLLQRYKSAASRKLHSTVSICYEYVVESTANPQHLDMSRCCRFVDDFRFVVGLLHSKLNSKSTTNRINWVWAFPNAASRTDN